MGASLNLYKLLSPNAFEQLQYTVERDNIEKNCTFILKLPILKLDTSQLVKSVKSKVVSE